MTVKTEHSVPEFARHWARELETPESSLVRLQGGINNRVFRCGVEGRYQWVIKGYAATEPGLRDRMQAEVEFLRYAEQVAPGFTPQLIHTDLTRRCVVLEHLVGEAFAEGVAPPKDAVSQAVEFFRCLNADQTAAKTSIKLDAAEGFLSLTEHLNNIEQRLGGMTCDHLPSDLKPKAKQLLAFLRSELECVREATINQIALAELLDRINPELRCVSPSDFGFHNAIMTREGTRFIDFEFSGWDDPAKTIVDFSLQPRIPFKHKISASPLISTLGEKRTNTVNRCKILEPILRLKWGCIVLAVLRAERLHQILSATPKADPMSLVTHRLHLAMSYIKYYD